MPKRKKHKIQLTNKTEAIKDVKIRFYGNEEVALVEEFVNKIKVMNLGKPAQTRETINSIFRTVLVEYIKHKTIEKSEVTVTKIVTPAVKNASREALNSLAELVNYRSETSEEQLEKITELLSFVVRWVALQNDIPEIDIDTKKYPNQFKPIAWAKKKD